jgi:hypothetical protein
MTTEGIDWADVEGGYEPPPEDIDGETRTSVTADERETIHPDVFWKTRPVLEHLHEFARARRVGPWAVLGATLARVIAATPPRVQIPPTIGGYASLNMFIGIVGNSGDGKDIAQKVARDALVIDGEPFKTNPVGSGEGLSHMFMRPQKPTRDDPVPDPVLYNAASLVTVGEIDTMGAMVQRNSSTLASQLRQGAMGEPLGFFYVDSAKRMIVPEHAYRLCMIVGIQPARSAVLLNDADGGTPQRLVWLPAGDPEAPDNPPEEPAPMVWEPPDWTQATRGRSAGAECFVVDLPECAVRAIQDARLARLRGSGEALDGHAVLTRTKVACALGVLEGRHRVTDADWDLSGTVMAVSDAQRGRCQRELSSKDIQRNEAQAVAEAERTLIVEDRISREKLPKVAQTIRRRLLREGAAGLPVGKLRNAVRSTDRMFFDDAMEALLNAGDVVSEEGRIRLR